jgi:cytochrome P450
MEQLGPESSALVFDIFSPEVTADPYRFYDRFRSREPVYRTPLGQWFLTRYEDVALVLRDRRFGRDYERTALARYGAEWFKEQSLLAMARWILLIDPPDHTRIRALMTQGFSARRVEAMRARIQVIADGLIDRVERRGQMDIVQDFALPLPTAIISELLGIPEEDRPRFIENFRITSRLVEPVPMNREELDRANHQIVFLEEHFRGLFELRRCEPQDDLITSLVQAESSGGQVSDQEIVANIILLFAAGYETTVNLIGNSLLSLHRYPPELMRLTSTPALLPNAVDELLRYESPVQFTGRQVLEDLEFGGKCMQKDDYVIACVGAANRDPAVFEDPDRLDLGRRNIRHLSFGGGMHFCLGAQLARIEAEIAIGTILRRLPNLRIEGAQYPKWRPTFVWRGLQSLQATWSVGTQ